MVSDSSLGKIICADFLRTIPRSNLTAAQFCFRIMSLLLLDIIQFCLQQSESLRLILKLRFLCLAVHHNAGRIMCQTYRGIRGIHALSPVSGRSHDIHPDILLINNNINVLIHLRHHSHTDGRGMNPAAALGLRHTLYPMHPALIFHFGVCTLAGNHELHFLHSSDTDFIHIQCLYSPALALRIMHIHTVNFRGKQSRFIPARTCADFHNHVFIVIGVLGQKQYFQLLLQLFHPLFILIQSLFNHLPHFFIIFSLQHCQRVFDFSFAFLVFRICVYNGSQIALFFHQLTKAFLITGHCRLMKFAHNFLKSNQQIF